MRRLRSQWKSLITGRKFARLLREQVHGSPQVRRPLAPDFFPSRDSSVLIAPAARHSALIIYYSETGVSPVERSSPDEETSLKLDINSGLRGRHSISGRPRVSVISQKVSGTRAEYINECECVCGVYLLIDRFSLLSDTA